MGASLACEGQVVPRLAGLGLTAPSLSAQWSWGDLRVAEENEFSSVCWGTACCKTYGFLLCLKWCGFRRLAVCRVHGGVPLRRGDVGCKPRARAPAAAASCLVWSAVVPLTLNCSRRQWRALFSADVRSSSRCSDGPELSWLAFAHTRPVQAVALGAGQRARPACCVIF